MKEDQLVNADAVVRFYASKDYMKVGIARYIPHKGSGRPVSVDLLAEQLTAAGIQVSLDVKAAKKVVAKLQAGEDISRIVIARGVAPVAGTNGRLTCFGDEKYPVFPDMAFGTLLPAIPAQAGLRIDGKSLEPPLDMQSCDLQVAMHSNCAPSPEGGQLVSQVYGTIMVTGCVVQILPLVTVSKDHLRVLGTLYHRDCLGMPITLERMQRLLSDMGVVAPLNEGLVRNALLRAAETGGAIQDVELARGVLPHHGTDGCLELLFDTMEMAGTVTEDGAINYKARGAVPVVCEGDPVAMLFPPTSGEAGKDVFGEVVPAIQGRPVPCVLCPASILEDEDGVTLRAKIDGVVQHAKGRLSVEDLFIVSSDVGMETGNVELQRAALLVRGNVLSGFSVRAPANVTVQGVVEAASVHVGGDFLAGGLVLQKQGEVFVEGCLNAGFINEGTVVVQGNVQVKKSIDNSQLTCDGFVALGHTGRIVGGTLRCKGGLRTGQLGNDLGVRTHIIVDLDMKALEDMEEEVLTKTAAVKRINQALGTGSDEEILKQTRQDKYKAVEKLLMIRQEAAVAAKEGHAKLKDLKKQCRERLSSVSVQVSGVVYPGVIVTFENRSFVVSSPVSQCEFRLAPSGKSVELRSLGKIIGESELSDDD
ncbi:FapA family protein [Oleidesulfovibrio sp.]|uniref:FapA family protein n=1 Tax=Oleidesulfovibrio sp. TaxID=2909707 RepID=UPI003A89319C